VNVTVCHRSAPATLACLALAFLASERAIAQQAAALPTAAQAPAPQTGPARAPFPNRANDVLPSWMRVRGEFRERMEGFDGAGFVDDREDLYWLSRFRFNATITPSKAFSFQAQVQDARVAKKTVGPTGAPFKAPVDLRMAFADIGSTTGPITVRLGRQELVYGEQRLVGHVSWLNAARTFDAAKITLRHSAFQVDAFGASVVRTLDGAFDRSGNGNRFAGAYATVPRPLAREAAAVSATAPAGAGAGHYLESVEPYVFWRRDTNLRGETGNVGDLKQTTVGVRLVGRLPARFDYGIEIAVQRGSLGADDLSAWAGHWQLRESLPGPGAVRLVGEYNHASGDKDASDGIRGTFDQLYPTPHDKYGLADQIGWKNVHHVRAGLELTPFRGLPVAANYHSWWLAERGDAAYAAGGAPLARVAGGATDRHVGQEIDLQVSRAVTPQIQLAAGYAHIFTGPFLKQATPGTSYSHPYVMVTYVFLAER
jgi:hypothetical protein